MAKRIRIIPWLDRSELDKQLNKVSKEKHKINVGVSGDGTNDMVQKLNRMNNTAVKSTSVFGNLKNTISNTFSSGKLAVTSYFAVLRGINTVARDAKEAIQELNQAETDLMIVTNESRESVKGLIKDYNTYGKQLASTTTEITDAADDFLRAGKTLEESQALIKDSIMLSKLGQIDSGTATEDLLATMNGYEVSIEEVDRALDSMVAIDMKAATSAGDLATGLKYSASSANAAGLEFNKLVAMLAVTQDRTQQTAQVIGAFLNTILSRFRDITIGKYLTDDGEDISNYESVLKSIGIELRDNQGEFRAFEDVLEEMANSWDSLTSVQQNTLIKVAAGTRQQNRFIALMENYNKVLELTEAAASSAGTAVDKFNSSYMTSLEAKQNTLQASFESMIYNMDLDEVYGGILDATTAMVKFIDKANLLKGVMTGLTGLTVVGGIKGFLALKSGIYQAYISLNQFQNALNMVKQTNISDKDFKTLLLLTNGLSESQLKLILSSQNLTLKQKEQLLVARGLSVEEANLKLQTLGITQAQTGLTASTTSAKIAMQGLISTLVAKPWFIATTVISGITMAFSAYKNSVEEVRQATVDAATAYKDSASSIDDYVSKYQDLREALIAAKGNEEENATVKQQLLDLQTELNDKYGEEYGKLNLVTDAYKDQTEAIRALCKEEANRLLNESRKGISTATNQMTKERDYVLSAPTLSVDTPDGKALQEIVDSYADEGMRLISDSTTGAVQIVLEADAETAYETLNNFETDLRNKAKELGNEHLFDGILDYSSNALDDAKSVVEEYGEIYHQALMAELVTDDSASEVYEQALTAVEEYNQAVAESEDPYNDEKVAEAKANVEAVKAEFANNEELTQFSSLFNNVFDQADTKLIDFHNKLKTDTSLQDWAEQLRGMDSVDLKSMVDDGIDDAFDSLVESAEEYGLEVEDVIDALIRLGYVQGEVQGSTFNNRIDVSFAKQMQEIHSLSEGLDQLDAIMADVINGETFDYSSILDPEGDFATTFSGFTEEYDTLIEAITNSPTDLAKSQKAFNDLATAFVFSKDAIKNLTAETKDAAVLDLKQMGVKNAEEIVNNILAFKDYTEALNFAEQSSVNLENATAGEISKLIDEQGALETTRLSLYGYYLNKFLCQSVDITTANDCQQLINLASQCKNTAEHVAILTKIMNLYNNVLSEGSGWGAATRELAEKEVESLKNQLLNLPIQTMADFGDGAKSAAAAQDKLADATDDVTEALEKQKEALENQKSEYEELHDAIIWFIDEEIEKVDEKIEAIQKENEILEERKDILDDIITAVTDNIDEEIDAIDEKIAKLQDSNSEEEKALALEHARQKLAEAKSRKTQLVYEEGKGFVYKTNKKNISEAESVEIPLHRSVLSDSIGVNIPNPTA